MMRNDEKEQLVHVKRKKTTNGDKETQNHENFLIKTQLEKQQTKNQH